MPLSAQVLNATATFTLGKLVRRTAAALPQTATTTIFNVVGGKVRVVALEAEVTTVIQAQSTVTKFRFTPTGGTIADVSGTIDINGFLVGAVIEMQGPTAAGALTQVPTSANFTGATGGMSLAGITLPAGALGFNAAASSTGALKFTMRYIPVDPGAFVTAA